MFRSGKRQAIARLAAIASLGAGALAMAAILLNQGGPAASSRHPLVVYCAAGVRPAVEPILARYEEEYGIATSLHLGPSGAVETQARLSATGDLIIPAAIEPFLARMQNDGVVREVLPAATLRLVVAIAPETTLTPTSVKDLAGGGLRLGLCNSEAAAGQRTEAVLRAAGVWEDVASGARVRLPTVTELAEAIRDGGRLDAGIVWSTTAKQFGLEYVDLPGLDASKSTIAVGVLDSARDPTAALRLARYLTATDRGLSSFASAHYECLPGDPWKESPELELFSGTVNRNAIADSLTEFEQREGCRVTTVFDGCGTLVGAMKAGASPDCYFACDVSYVEKVTERFGTPLEVSDNPMVILTRRGNPLAIHGMEDLAREDVLTGLCDPDLTALGSLTRRLLHQAALYDRVVETGVRTVTTGDLLVAQMLAGERLDAAVVYRANCVAAEGDLEVIEIDHPAALAVQPFSIANETRYPRLAERLRAHLVSQESRKRFEHWGFGWRADEAVSP